MAGGAEYYRGSDDRMLFPKEPTELSDRTHFHLFIMSLIFLADGHLFLMSTWSSCWKTFVAPPGSSTSSSMWPSLG